MSIPTLPERTPQIGDILQHKSGTIVIVEKVYVSYVLHTRIMHIPKHRRLEVGATMRIATDLMGVSWRIVA